MQTDLSNKYASYLENLLLFQPTDQCTLLQPLEALHFDIPSPFQPMDQTFTVAKKEVQCRKHQARQGDEADDIAKAPGLLIAVHTTSANPHESTFVEGIADEIVTAILPKRFVGDHAFNSDTLDEKRVFCGNGLIELQRRNRKKPAAQDDCVLRWHKQCWRIECLFVWQSKF